jgi:hypothetical protein
MIRCSHIRNYYNFTMKKLISTVYFSFILSCLSLVSCSSAPKDLIKEDVSNAIKQSQTESSPASLKEENPEPEIGKNQEENKKPVRENSASTVNNKEAQQPKVGTVKALVNGDLMCYVTLSDPKGIEHNVGATFEVCAEEGKFLNKQVRAVYEVKSVNDCESAEPCGKSRQESIITKMEVVSAGSEQKPASANSQTLSNGEWTITISNTDSWNGVNGTGNVSYRGCDANGKCLSLKGGKIICRNGKCVTAWKNGDYVYIVEQAITEDGNGDSTLIVRKDTTEILKATGLKAVSGN